MPEKKATPITVAEHDGITDPPTKRVLLYGWDGTTKRRLSTDASGVLNVGATFSANASQAVVSTSHSSLKAASQLWGADATIATVASLANRNALAVITVDSTGAIQSPLVSGSSVSAFQGGTWNVTATATDLDIRNLVFATDKVDASGSSVMASQAGTWNIGTVTTVSAVTAISNALPAGDNNIGNVDLASAIPAGTNNIGDVDILSIAAGDNNIGNVDIASIAAGDNNIGNVDVVTLPALPAGTNNIGDVDAIQSGTWTVQPGNTANTTPWLTTITPGTGGGWSSVSTASLSSTALTIKGSAGTFGGYYFYNPNSTVIYVQVFNATAPTVGTTAPTLIYGVPATAGANVEIANGVAMSTAMTWAATMGPTNSSAPTSNLVATAYYK